MSDFEILVNGKLFRNWKSAIVTRSLDENAGKFEFTSSGVFPANYPVRAGDAVKILIDGAPKLTGFCEVIKSNQSSALHDITVAGRDNACDLIDSTVPDSIKSIFGPLSMKGLIEKTISAIGANIKVINSVQGLAEFSELEFFGSDAGKECMSFLTNFARKRQVYLITDGDGRLIIFRPSEQRLPGELIKKREGTNNNIVSSAVTFDHSERFSSYSVRSQDNFGADPDADYSGGGVDRKGNATDDQIRTSRILEIQPEENMFDEETKDRAKEELNIRRARSTSYIAKAQGVQRSPGILWDIGQLTKVNDEAAGVQGYFIVRSVEYIINANEGSLTTLTMAPPEAYNVRIPTQADFRRAKQGANFQTQVPPKPGFNR